jgi:RNA polymerase sigma-70 factor (ECF subfamily)
VTNRLHMDSDQLLVRRAIDGDERAMRMLWTRHAPHVDAVVRRLVGDPDAAADVAQDVWIQIFRALPSWRGDSQFGTWIHRVAVNRTLNALRRLRRTGKVETSLDEATDDQPGSTLAAALSVDPDGERALLATSIEEAARKLSPGARQVFMLHDVEGYTHEEIAESLGITAGGSKSQLFKARAKLRRLLSHLVDGSGGHGTPTDGYAPTRARSAPPSSAHAIRHQFAPHAAPGY